MGLRISIFNTQIKLADKTMQIKISFFVKISGEPFNNKFISETGDEVPKDDCTKLLETLAEPEDEDGFFPYTSFLVNYLILI